ncbi:hypothetical protein [Vibrio sp. PNB22_3_1]
MQLIKNALDQIDTRHIDDLHKECGIAKHAFCTLASHTALTKHPVRDFTLNEDLLSARLVRNLARVTANGIEKFCPKCSNFSPLNTLHWYKDKSNTDGATGHCRSCIQNRYHSQFNS